ncbi:MAG: arginine deiminase [Oscillospiraceae bacterium]|nr:arginine deiminase [Oscillospiraceae bacterium]
MPIFVKSEIAPLKRVMLHRPGKELEHLTPGTLDRLLFDDIPFLAGAQQEHDQFAKVLRDSGAEVVYLEDLAAETLKANPGLREMFLKEFATFSPNVDYRPELFQYLMSIPDDKELILKTMAGVSFRELGASPKFTLPAMLNRQNNFVLEPMPNLYFTRDPFESIGEGVAINRMYSVTRCQETIFARYIFKYHPEFGGDQVPLYANGTEHYSLEGGDVLNLSAEVVAIGISQRTTPEAIENLARRLFADDSATVRTVLALEIPCMRATMHLDTVLTQVDHDKFVVFPDMLDSLRIFEISPGAKNALNICDLGGDLRKVLEKHLHQDHIELILCGGGDNVAAQREQWNDGSNTLCVAPGKVVAYNRNVVTNKIFEEHGITVLKIPSGELSRGRGGPRCMSMPLNRAKL